MKWKSRLPISEYCDVELTTEPPRQRMNPVTTSIAEAQADMRAAYAGGGLGMLTSSLAWCTAGGVAWIESPSAAVIALLIGGVLIHPVATLLEKAVGRSASHAKGNPLASLAMASTAWLILSLPLAYVVSLYRTEWFFPAMLFVIGGRYLTFSTLFGSRIYLVCGAALAAAGVLLVKFHATAITGAFTGSAIEAIFAFLILRFRRS